MVYALRFDAALAAMPAEAFFDQVLRDGLGAVHLSCGQDFAFGHRRGGDAGTIARLAEAAGIGTTIVPPLVDAQGPISSTRIRRALQDGYPERATAMLGRPWEIRGEVVHGDKLGRVLGWPTANMWLGRHLEPARGVYAVTVALPDGTEAKGVANVGRRPTLGGDPETRLETYIFRLVGRHLRPGDRRAAGEIPSPGCEIGGAGGAEAGDRAGCRGCAAGLGVKAGGFWFSSPSTLKSAQGN